MKNTPDHIILITGTTRGLGKAIAEHFLDRGSMVIGCARTETTISHAQYVRVFVRVAEKVAPLLA
ncbi:MAG: SDR family NAD(P)-dependent oxidoreductase [Desulfobulbus sp.]